MKHKVRKYFSGAVMAFLLSAGTVGIVCSGFDLDLESMPMLLLWCGMLAAGTAVLPMIPHGGKVTLVLMVISLTLCLGNEELWMQTQTLLCCITSHFHDYLDWPVWGQMITVHYSGPLVLWAAVVCIAVSFYFCRRKGLPVVLALTLATLALCMVTRMTVPDPVYLFLLMTGVGLLLITDWTGRHHHAKAVRLIWQMAVPVAVFVALIFFLNPQDRYVNHAPEFVQKVKPWIDWFDDVTGDLFPDSTAGVNGGKKLNLQNVGPKSNRSFIVMVINSSYDGPVYLRGIDYDIYSGASWTSSLNRRETISGNGAGGGTLTVTTFSLRSTLYIPYYSTEPITLKDGIVRNDGMLQEYSFTVSDHPAVSADPPDAKYTELPQETMLWAARLVNGITGLFDSDAEKVRAIQSYVHDSADYNRYTSRMDSAHDDFARWFLEESDKGYCVHFATSATVLLRAAGIPARYVEGYLVHAIAAEDVTVTNQDAHAWVEYYDTALKAWRILEVTPPDRGAAGEETTEPTVVPETILTEPPTEPEPSETAPTDTTPEDTEPESVPHNPGGNGGNGQQKVPLDLRWVGTVLWIFLIFFSVILQSDLRIRYKRWLWKNGGPNDQAITRWHQTQWTAKLLKQPFPEELDALAQKAKFSQHQMKPEELRRFDAYRNTLTEKLYSRPWYQVVFFRLVFAITK